MAIVVVAAVSINSIMYTRHPMHFFSFPLLRTFTLGLGLAFACSASMADKPEWAGKGKGKHREQAQSEANNATVEVRVGGYFEDHQRREAEDYYGKQRKAGHCPPGLAKKNNGCMPPGQAKKWAMGQALPQDVVFYPVPNAVIVKIGLPPAGYRYVRVANDLLLLAIGSRMVVDAIEDLMKP